MSLKDANKFVHLNNRIVDLEYRLVEKDKVITKYQMALDYIAHQDCCKQCGDMAAIALQKGERK